VPNGFHPGSVPALGRLVFRVIPEAFTRIAEFESGTLDILRIPHAELERFLSDEERQELIQSQPELRVTYIGLNNRKGPLSDVRVRRALNMAVDVERIITVLASGHATRSAGAVPPGLRGMWRERRTHTTPRRRGDSSAKRDTDGFDLEIWQRDSPEGNRVVEAVQGYLLEIGIRVRIVKREWSAFKEAVSAGRVDAFFLDWYGDYPDAGEFSLTRSSIPRTRGGGGNRSFFNDALVDSLVERVAEHARRRGLCRSLRRGRPDRVRERPLDLPLFPDLICHRLSGRPGIYFPGRLPGRGLFDGNENAACGGPAPVIGYIVNACSFSSPSWSGRDGHVLPRVRAPRRPGAEHGGGEVR